MKIANTQGASTRHGVKILVFGPPGVTKTRSIKTLPTPFIISAEGGLLSLSDANIPFVEVRNIADLYEVWNWVSTSAEARKFASFALDSISEIAEICLAFQKTQTKDGRKAYGDTAEQVSVIVKNFRNLSGPNVYFTAKQGMIKNDGGTPPVFAAPMMPGNQLGQSIPFDFDIVMQLLSNRTPEGQIYSMFRTKGAHEFDVVKDRSGKLQEWEQPDLGAIIRKITGV